MLGNGKGMNGPKIEATVTQGADGMMGKKKGGGQGSCCAKGESGIVGR